VSFGIQIKSVTEKTNLLNIVISLSILALLIPATMWSKAYICGILLAGIAVSNPVESTELRPLCLLRFVSLVVNTTG
jgi:hypothetical protein